MTIQEDSKTLPLVEQNGEEEMAIITCSHCDFDRNITMGTQSLGTRAQDWVRADILRSVLTCGKCKELTVFTMNGRGGILFALERGQVLPLHPAVTKGVSDLYFEAQLCFYGKANRAVPGMCRAAVEEALKEKNVKGKDLFERIDNALNHKVLELEQTTPAQGVRLIGRDALHRLMQISPAQAVGLLSVAADLVNHIAQQPIVPATQSETGSNEP